MLPLINPGRLPKPFDHAGWVFEVKFDGFRAAADTVHGRLISRNGNLMPRFERVLGLLPKGHVFDGWLRSTTPGARFSTSCCLRVVGRLMWPSIC